MAQRGQYGDPRQASVRLYHESLERATHSPQFLNRFYYRFIGSGHDVANLFRGRDMERTKRKLKTALELATDSANRVPGMDMYLEMLGRIHDRLHVPQSNLPGGRPL